VSPSGVLGCFTSKLDLNLRRKLVKLYIWSAALYDAETCTVRKVDKDLESFEIWFWRRLEKMSDMKYYVLKEERNILPTVKRRKANWSHLA
jgi:hypothetical protein